MRALRLIAPALLLAVGCSGLMQHVPGGGVPGPWALPGFPGDGPTEAEVRDSLVGWAETFEALVTAASDHIRAETATRDARRHTLLWQLRMIPLARQAAFRQDPQESYVAVLATATAQHEYLRSGEGKEIFGPHQRIAVDAAARIEEIALQVGRSFLEETQLARLEQQVDELVATHPIRGVFVADSLLQGFVASSAGGMFSWVADVPMVPFRTLRGVSDTAQAVQTFNEATRDLSHTVADLPHLTRWQLELLLYDAEELESVSRALAAAESLAGGAERISHVAETLPEELGAELAARLEEARRTLGELDAALARAEHLAAPLERISQHVAEASSQWAEILGAGREPAEPGPAAEPGRPFDVREYEATAARVAEASRELRTLVAELDTLDPPVATELVDRIAWRAALLMVLFFVALALYRFATRRWR